MRRLLLRCYPRRWRARYGDELLALLDDSGFGPREALDLARNGISQRAADVRRAIETGGTQMTIGPAWRHPTGWAVAGAIMLAPTLVFVGLSYLAYELGIDSLQGAMGSVSQVLNQVRPLDLVLVAAPLLALAVALLPLLRLELHPGDGGTEAQLGLRLRAANLAVVLAALVVGGLLVGHIVVESVLRIGP